MCADMYGCHRWREVPTSIQQVEAWVWSFTSSKAQDDPSPNGHPTKTYLVPMSAVRLLRYFSKGDVQLTNRHMKRCSTSHIIREIQTKVTMTNHLTPVRMATITKPQETTGGVEGREKGTLVRCWWEWKLGNTVWRFLETLKIEVPYDLVIQLLRYLPKKYENTNLKRYGRAYVYCNIIYNGQTMETARVSINRLMDKEDMVYIHTVEYYSAIKKNEILQSAKRGWVWRV